MSQNKPRILVVDDVTANIQLLAGLLDQDYQIKVATNGERALTIAQSDSPPDLILLDIMMPEMDGYEVCRRLKSNELTSKIPVIFVSAKDEEQDQVMGFNLGAVDYIAKPFNLAIVKARVKVHIALKQKTEALERLTLLDGLTNIGNRRKFQQILHELSIKANEMQQTLSVIMMDIDYFKAYNDGYGHGAGDDCLVAVAKQLQRSLLLLGMDPALVCRYGGEEFVLVLLNQTTQSLLHIAHHIQQDIDALNIQHHYSLTANHITLSMGCASQQVSREDSLVSLLKQADDKLYEAKNGGRNQVKC